MPRLDETTEAVLEIAAVVSADADRFRELDALVGDGDLGVTVRDGLASVADAVQESDPEDFAQLFETIGRAFAAPNPSTLANLVKAGCRAAARRLDGVTVVEPAAWADVLDDVVRAVQTKGKASVGDKTILDALNGSLERLRSDDPTSAHDVAAAIREGAEDAAASLVDLQSRAGRASWQGERTIGVPDPGAEVWASVARAIEQRVAPNGARRS